MEGWQGAEGPAHVGRSGSEDQEVMSQLISQI